MTAALELAELGWAVFPLHWPKVLPSGEVKCTCGNADCGNVGKHPMTPNGLTSATTDTKQIRDWWRQWTGANIGVATGAASGIVVLDVDPRHGGDESLRGAMDEHGELPETVEARTGGGGRHFVFAHPGSRVSNSHGAKGWLGRSGLDVKGDGGYIVVAPSLHASGNRYAWEPGASPFDLKPSALPAWLVPPERLKPRHLSDPVYDDAGTFWLGKALAKATDGSRNDTGCWLALQLRDNGVALGEAERVMADYAARCPGSDHAYRESEALATVRGIYRTPPREPAKSLVSLGARQVAKPAAPAEIKPAATNAATELRDYLRDVVDKRVVDARLPWPLLSKLSCAMLPGSVTTLCGDPGVGKTFWTLECLRYWHGNGHDPAAYFIEKNRRFYSMRLLAQLEGRGCFVDHDWIAANGDEVDAALDRHGDYIAELGRCIHSSETGRVTLPDLLAWIRQMASAGKRVLIVDPITAVNAGRERWVADDDFMVEASRICIAHGASLVLITHPKGGSSARKSGHDVGGGAAYFRFCDTLVWVKRLKKPKRVRVRCISPVGVRETIEKCGLTFDMHKTRDGKGAGIELAYSFGDGLHFAEHGIIVGECAEAEGEAA
jgi:hypothetical protein